MGKISLNVLCRPGRTWESGPSGRYPARVPVTPLLLGADDSFSPFLGDDLIVYLVLAMGAALVAGNLAALLRPPQRPTRDGDLQRAPVARSMVMVAIGLLAAIWALVSLVS